MKRYTAPFQKLQLLIVYTALSTVMCVSLVVSCVQARGTGDGWSVAVLILLMTTIPTYAAFSTYRNLLVGLGIEGTDPIGANAPDHQVQS